MKINITDIELDYLLRSGKSRKYDCLAGKKIVLSALTLLYNILSSIERFEDLFRFKSLQIQNGGDGTYFIKVDSSYNIQMVLLLQGDVVNLLPLIITENDHE